ncbi:hypothetical protein Dvina_14165 [Dactylosporangium vinaceum]|uniref:DUF5753 domain-containing protein n=1 Tax=Dactylosporangium vinaceum TaxID=53362 RepID=A0ABV5MHN8_9ACTN|nr:DUF5753 domain-containing protein [Dactylosporangium vinaceum]UAB99115.1 hypothetical protein Dvina_14165 [Dactylosporangium vinaceum]
MSGSMVRGWGAFERFVEFERESARVHVNQLGVLPALLQVASYSAAIIGGIAGIAADDPGLIERVQARLRRTEAFRKRLEGPQRPHLWAVFDESALRRRVGGDKTMREQIDHLRLMAEFDTVHLGIVPFTAGAYPGLGGSYEVHEHADGTAMVFFESAHADEFVEGEPGGARERQAGVEALMASGAVVADPRDFLESLSRSLS